MRRQKPERVEEKKLRRQNLRGMRNKTEKTKPEGEEKKKTKGRRQNLRERRKEN